MKMIKINMSFTFDEVNAVLSGLSALPTGNNVWPLAMRIKQEAETQVPPPGSEDKKAEDTEKSE
jgi:hypothetical protein